MKKALSLFLSLIMVFTVFTVAMPAAFAEGEAASQMKYIGADEAFRAYREVITEVAFVNTLADAPESGYVWDVSEAGDGSVKAWLTNVVENGTVVSAKLIIGANGKIKLNKVSSELFDRFMKVTSIDFGGVADTSEVMYMDGMFDSCFALESVNFGDIDTSKATTFSRMFKDCASLKTIDISALDSQNVTDFSRMFENCESLVSLDLSTLDIGKSTTLAAMMKGCRKLEIVRIDNWYFPPQLTDITEMFRACNSLTDIYIYDISHHGESKPNQDYMYVGVYTHLLKFHDNRNIGTDNELWTRYFDDAEGAELVFDTPEHFKIKLNPEGDITLAEGQSVTFTAQIIPEPDKYELTWETDNIDVAEVDKNGKLTATGIGVTTLTVTNKTVVNGETKVDSVKVKVTVVKAEADHYCVVKYELPENVGYAEVSKNDGKTYLPVHNGGTYDILKGTDLIIRPYSNALIYKFYVNNELVETEENGILRIKADKNLIIRIEASDITGEETVSFFEKIINWFREMFQKLFSWF